MKIAVVSTVLTLVSAMNLPAQCFTLASLGTPSLDSIDDATAGARVRAKRKAQADFLAGLVQLRQIANPGEHIVVLGDLNAFPFSDGYVDSVGIIRGLPAPFNSTVLPGADLVNPDLADALDSIPRRRNAIPTCFDGNSQTLDQILYSSNLQNSFAGLDHPRINADFPEVLRNHAGPKRLSDHDPAIAYFRFPAADLGLSISYAPASVTGETTVYSYTVTNSMNQAASQAVFSTSIPAGLAVFSSFSAPPGWSCTTPAAGSAGAISCTDPSLAARANDVLTVSVIVACPVPNLPPPSRIPHLLSVPCPSISPRCGRPTTRWWTCISATRPATHHAPGFNAW